MAGSRAKIILITGGARSGKSSFAQELALKSGQPVLFVATAEAGDDEMRRRIEAHKRARPKSWKTLEVRTRIGSQIAQGVGEAKTVVIDCITLLVNNVFSEHGGHGDREVDADVVEKGVMTEISELVHCMKQVQTGFIIVTNEVGLGIVPADRTSRLYRDLLGKANQILTRHVDEVYLMVSGLPLRLKTGGGFHVSSS
ncbi:bifunctional adenosylcobinamide kinase/adenosylcobinamide-phosphate guanylyltransferase [Chloroflexota bacterium]